MTQKQGKCSVTGPEVTSFHDLYDERLICSCILNHIGSDTKTVLSLGCGDLSVERNLAETLPDIELMCVDRLTSFHDSLPDNIRFIQGDVNDEGIPAYKQKYDFVYSFSLLQYLKADNIKELNSILIGLLNDNGKIIHFDIPDKRKKLLYRMNTAVDMRVPLFRALSGQYDFIDSESRWHDIEKLSAVPNASVYIHASSIHFERCDMIIQRNE